jgi:glucose/arabinose dehydrogenase
MPLADLKVPPGFRVSVFASDLAGARMMTMTPEGVLLVARWRTNEVVTLPDKDRDGRAEPQVILSDLTNAHSLAFKDGYLYVATTPAVMRDEGRPPGGDRRFHDRLVEGRRRRRTPGGPGDRRGRCALRVGRQ